MVEFHYSADVKPKAVSFLSPYSISLYLAFAYSNHVVNGYIIAKQMGNKTVHSISLATSYLLLGKEILLTCHFKLGRKALSQFQVFRIIFNTWSFSVPSIPAEF